MSEHSGGNQKDSRDDFWSQVQTTRDDLEKQFNVHKARLEETSQRIKKRTGRDLVLATFIALTVGTLALLSLVFVKEMFVFVAMGFVAIASLELALALHRNANMTIPRIPTVFIAAASVPASFFFGLYGLFLTLVLGVFFLVLWRLLSYRAQTSYIRDLAGSISIQLYLAVLASFGLRLLAQDGGEKWIIAFLLLVVVNDTSAYVSGLIWGKRPLAPRISPKKTWEGFFGAVIITITAGMLVAVLLLEQQATFGILFGVCIVISATFGDLGESYLKRRLGIKDMGAWFLGHGGILDRLDSILPSAVVAYILYTLV